jgi:hypothetical protein
MDVLAHISAAAVTALFLAINLVDDRVSRTYPMHNNGEGNDLLEDSTGADAGYYEPAKLYIQTVAFLIPCALLWAFFPWGWAAPIFILGGFSIKFGITVWGNRKDMLRRKAEQFTILRRIKAAPETFTTRITAFQENKTRKPMWFAQPHFWDVRCYAEGAVNDPNEIERAKGVLIAKMRKLAAMDEKTWWSVDRAKNL